MSSSVTLFLTYLLLFGAISKFMDAYYIIEKAADRYLKTEQFETCLRQHGAYIAFRQNILSASRHWMSTNSGLSQEISQRADFVIEQLDSIYSPAPLCGESRLGVALHKQTTPNQPDEWPNWTFRFVAKR